MVLALLLVALFLATPIAPAPLAPNEANAQPPASAPTGIWRGTLSDQQIIACFDGRSASFYHFVDKKFHRLWSEKINAFTSSDDEFIWRINSMQSERLVGEQIKDGLSTPFSLQPVAIDPALDVAKADDLFPIQPCESMTYHRDRIEPLQTAEKPTRMGSTDYVQIHAFAPSDPDSYSYLTLRLNGSTPKLDKVNAILDKAIDRRGPGKSDWSQCLMLAGNSGSSDTVVLAPRRMSKQFLVIDESYEIYCGGNHPDFDNGPRIFDLSSGTEIDISDWLASSALNQNTKAQNIGDAAGREEGDFVLRNAFAPSPSLLKVMLNRTYIQHIRTDYQPCVEVVKEAQIWTMTIGPDGFIFAPVLPHVSMACKYEVSLSFDAMVPFLIDEGKRAVAILRAEPFDYAPPK